MADLPDVGICYPAGANWLCAYTQEELDTMAEDPAVAFVMARSDALAWSTLSSLTAYRVSLCPTVLRPCLAGCSSQTWNTAPVAGGGTLSPFISNGVWYNGCGCKSDDCSCTSLCEVIMPAEVGSIESISIDGADLDPSAYRVDNGRKVVRTDGECWPSCQDMSVGPSDVGSFTITYYPGIAPNDLLRYAAGVLAVEFYRACSGGDCRLPSGVTSITRAGMSMQLPGGTFIGGTTGIPEVDAVIRIYNPGSLKGPSRVLSPDRSRGRIQTGAY